MLDAVPGKDDPVPLVHPNGDADDDRSLRIAETLSYLIRDVRDGDGLVELRNRHAVQRRVPLERGMGKRFGRARHGGAECSLSVGSARSKRGAAAAKAAAFRLLRDGNPR